MNLTKRLIGNRVVLGFVVAIALIVAAETVRAGLVTYSYVGNPFVGTDLPGVTGTVTLDNTGIAPTDWGDGTYYYYFSMYSITAATLTSTAVGLSLTLDPPSVQLPIYGAPFFLIDLNGHIFNWALELDSYGAYIYTRSDSYDSAAMVVDGNWVSGNTSYQNPGTWTLVSSSPVPLPASALLLAPGLLGLLAMRRRLKK